MPPCRPARDGGSLGLLAHLHTLPRAQKTLFCRVVTACRGWECSSGDVAPVALASSPLALTSHVASLSALRTRPRDLRVAPVKPVIRTDRSVTTADSVTRVTTEVLMCGLKYKDVPRSRIIASKSVSRLPNHPVVL